MNTFSQQASLGLRDSLLSQNRISSFELPICDIDPDNSEFSLVRRGKVSFRLADVQRVFY